MATKSRAKFDLKTEATRPLYAYVGATDLAVETVRDYVADLGKRAADVQKSVTSFDAKSLREQAVKAVSVRVEELQKDAKARRADIEKRVADLRKDAEELPTRMQSSVDENVKVVGDAYGDLVKRGESLVSRIRNQASTQEAVKGAKTTVAKAKTTATQAKKAVDAEVTATKKVVTAEVAEAKKAVADVQATVKKAAKKAPARKAPAKKTTAAERSAKATVTSARKTAAASAKAVVDAAEKIGD